MDHDVIVEQWLDRCKGFIANILQAPDLHSVASASLAIFAPMRQVARDMLQAKMTLEAQERTRADVTPCCQEAGVTFVHTRTVSPATWCGAITSPVRTVQCHGGGALCRPDDRPLGVPEAGDFTDDGRALSAPGAAELPHRVASALLQQGTGVALSSGGAQGIIDSTAEDLRTWHAKRERREAAAVADALASGDGTADLRVEIAREGVTTHLDGRWPQPQVATSLVRQLDTQTEEPTLGVLLARPRSGPPASHRLSRKPAGRVALAGRSGETALLGSGLWRMPTFPECGRRWTTIISARISRLLLIGSTPPSLRGPRPGWIRTWGRSSRTAAERGWGRSRACGPGKTWSAMLWPG